MSAARFPPEQHRRWTISARELRPNEEGTQPRYPVETAASSVAPERGKGKPWPARLETRAHLPRSHLRPGRHHQPVTLSAAGKLCLRAFQGWGSNHGTISCAPAETVVHVGLNERPLRGITGSSTRRPEPQRNC